MKDIEYDSGRPLMRLEKGDRAIIRVNSPTKDKYADIKNGVYKAICTEPYALICEEQPLLNGKYCYWYGNKWGCSGGIYADEIGGKKDS